MKIFNYKIKKIIWVNFYAFVAIGLQTDPELKNEAPHIVATGSIYICKELNLH